MSKHAPNAEDIERGLSAVAQALINIAEGTTTIEKDSLLYRELSLLMKPVNVYAMYAAPEMLEALRGLLSAHEDSTAGLSWRLQKVEEARAAIGKAEGRS